MDEQDLIGYMWGLRIEVRFQKVYHYELFKKMSSSVMLSEKMIASTKTFGYVSEERLIMDLLGELIEDWQVY